MDYKTVVFYAYLLFIGWLRLPSALYIHYGL